MTMKQDRIDDYITTYTGVKFYPLNPRPEDISILDIAHALSNLSRFTGHGKRHYSVAEHSIYCTHLLMKMTDDPKILMYGLFHDASEAYCNDIARPLKQNLPEYMAVEKRIQEAVYRSIGLPYPTQEEYQLVKLADDIMLINECQQLLPKDAELNLPKIEWKKEYRVKIPNRYQKPKKIKRKFIDLYILILRALLEVGSHE